MYRWAIVSYSHSTVIIYISQTSSGRINDEKQGDWEGPGTKPRPCNKWVTPLHRHIINEHLEMTVAFLLKQNQTIKLYLAHRWYKIRAEVWALLYLTMVTQRPLMSMNRSIWSAWSWFWRGYPLDVGMVFAITNKSPTFPQHSVHPNATIVLQMN